jgi:hypothetical protein
MDEMVAAEDNDLVEVDRSSMDVMLEMMHTGVLFARNSRAGLRPLPGLILSFEICEEAVKRFLNARRISFRGERSI